MKCIKAERKECDLEACYHFKKHKKDESCNGVDRCHFDTPCVTNGTHLAKQESKQ